MSEETKESQNDEREALISIYEGDNAFKQVNPTTFLYKVCINLFHIEADIHNLKMSAEINKTNYLWAQKCNQILNL